EDITDQRQLAEGPRDETQRALGNRPRLRPPDLVVRGWHTLQRWIALVVIGAPELEIGLRHSGGRPSAEITRLLGQPQPAEGRWPLVRLGPWIHRAHHVLPSPSPQLGVCHKSTGSLQEWQGHKCMAMPPCLHHLICTTYVWAPARSHIPHSSWPPFPPCDTIPSDMAW